MTSSLRPVALLVLLLGASPAWAVKVKPFVADYQATMKGVQADAKLVLSSAGGDRWNYRLSIQNPLGMLEQTTVFEDRSGTWRPLSGTDTVQMLVKKSKRDASYDWAKGEARWSGDVKAHRMGPIKLQEGDLDTLMLNLAIVRDVGAGKALKYRLVDNGVVRQQVFQNLGTESITVGGKAQTATKISRSSEGKQVIVWVVDGLPVPARILQRDDGKDSLNLVLKSVR